MGRLIGEMYLRTHAEQIPPSARPMRAHLQTIGNAHREIYAPPGGEGGRGENPSKRRQRCHFMLTLVRPRRKPTLRTSNTQRREFREFYNQSYWFLQRARARIYVSCINPRYKTHASNNFIEAYSIFILARARARITLFLSL